MHTYVTTSVDVSTSTRPWTPVDVIPLIKAVPELIAWFNTLGLKIRDAAITYIDSDIPHLASLPLHIDQLPVIAKINIPIFNTDGYLNRWFSITDSYYHSLMSGNNDDPIDKSQCEFLGEVDMKNPIVLNSAIPHEVVNTGTGKNPRIVLSCIFFNEPIHYLEP